MIYDKYPKLSLVFVRTKYIIQQILVIFLLIVLIFVEVNAQPSLINWGFVILSLVFLWIILAGKANKKAYLRSSIVAKWLKRYAGFMLLLSVLYFLLTEQEVINDSHKIMQISDMIGLKAYKDSTSQTANTNISYIWDYFFSYLAFMVFGIFLEQYYKTQAENSEKESQEEKSLKMKVVFENEKELKRYHESQRLSMAYLIYRIRNAWRFIDPIALYFHVLTNTLIIYLAINYELSLFMAINLCCIVYFYVSSSIKLHIISNKM